MSEGIDPEKALRSIAKLGPLFAKAKADRIYCEEYRKTLKAQLMKDAQVRGIDASNAQEREAYAHADYVAHLEALREAVQIEETARWHLVAAEAAIEVWRSMEASNRRMDRAAQ